MKGHAFRPDRNLGRLISKQNTIMEVVIRYSATRVKVASNEP